jgi:hypothetical protein
LRTFIDILHSFNRLNGPQKGAKSGKCHFARRGSMRSDKLCAARTSRYHIGTDAIASGFTL